MKKEAWKKKIKGHCIEAGTYRPFFESLIDTLAGLMEARDSAWKEFLDTGARAVTPHINTSGATNLVRNPALGTIIDCNAQALQYWQALGLTAKSYKQIYEGKQGAETSKRLEDFLADLGV